MPYRHTKKIPTGCFVLIIYATDSAAHAAATRLHMCECECCAVLTRTEKWAVTDSAERAFQRIHLQLCCVALVPQSTAADCVVADVVSVGCAVDVVVITVDV